MLLETSDSVVECQTFCDKTHISGRFQTLYYPPHFVRQNFTTFFEKIDLSPRGKIQFENDWNLNTCDHPTHHSKKKQYFHTSGTPCFFRFWSVHEKNWCSFWGGYDMNFCIKSLIFIFLLFFPLKTYFWSKRRLLKQKN